MGSVIGQRIVSLMIFWSEPISHQESWGWSELWGSNTPAFASNCPGRLFSASDFDGAVRAKFSSLPSSSGEGGDLYDIQYVYG